VTTATFEQYLEELADQRQQLAISKLVMLSLLSPEDTALLATSWPGVEVARRRRIVQELIELAEDNVEINFDAAFLVALADGDAEVRRDAIRGLWEHEGRGLIDSLLRLLEHDPDAVVRAEAALALGRFVLKAEFDTLRPKDVERIEQALRRAFGDAAEVVEVRARALEAIGARGQPWVPELIEQAMDSADRPLRLSALHAMGRSCNNVWLPELFDAAASDDAEVRFEAATALGAIADEAAVPHLVSLLDDDDGEVREAAIIALGEVGGDVALEALKRVAEDEDERMREAAQAALADAEFSSDPLGVKMRDEA
jgi:HEAT repeat protein